MCWLWPAAMCSTFRGQCVSFELITVPGENQLRYFWSSLRDTTANQNLLPNFSSSRLRRFAPLCCCTLNLLYWNWSFFHPIVQNACAQCKARNRDWIWVQCNYENTKTEWKKVDMMMGDSEVPKALEQDVALLDSLEFPKHLTQLPSWVLMLYGLKRLDLSYCEHLETLPFE